MNTITTSAQHALGDMPDKPAPSAATIHDAVGDEIAHLTLDAAAGPARVAAAIQDGLGDGLAKLAGALEVPVLLAAVAILLLCALELGRFATERWRRAPWRRRNAVGTLAALAHQHPERAEALAARAPDALSAQAIRDIAAARGDRDAIERALADYELRVQRRLDRTRLLVRAGPAVGLMGTLIPLAPGLAALRDGDVARLADDLRVAFAATVLGLLVGTVAFALTLARARTYTEELTALERATASPGRPAPAGTVTAPPDSPGPAMEAAR
jgi:biopolymer transport protein ExbB/TolQ